MLVFEDQGRDKDGHAEDPTEDDWVADYRKQKEKIYINHNHTNMKDSARCLSISEKIITGGLNTAVLSTNRT